MSDEEKRSLPRFGVQAFKNSFLAAARQPLSVRTEGDAAYTALTSWLHNHQLPAGVGIPDYHFIAGGGAGDSFSVGTEREITARRFDREHFHETGRLPVCSNRPGDDACQQDEEA